MFNELLAESVAKATFWILIIVTIGITLRFLIRDIVDFILGDKGDGKKEDEE